MPIEEIKKSLRDVLIEFFGEPKSTSDLDSVYDIAKNNLGYVSIKDLREQLGLTLEQFMGKFRNYIMEKYDLIAGGDEGFLINGSIYGIIKRKA
ncbi:PepK [Acidianus sulfidivorans JP7]|uniref:PepK n=1 Tax=Acidianus sulfidivorans JP7 TaxID=619593 RepID=A0A2U9IQB1_9CREN|nr:PepK [Acidianus sulfidivorans JP7]